MSAWNNVAPTSNVKPLPLLHGVSENIDRNAFLLQVFVANISARKTKRQHNFNKKLTEHHTCAFHQVTRIRYHQSRHFLDQTPLMCRFYDRLKIWRAKIWSENPKILQNLFNLQFFVMDANNFLQFTKLGIRKSKKNRI